MTTGPILVPGSSCMEIVSSDDSGLVVDGADYYRAFFETASQARRYVLISGWQLDSEARLLRGEEATSTDRPVEFLAFLDDLCRRRKDLHVYILAWDYSWVYALERERMQQWLFERSSHRHVHFVFDAQHPVGASHHQKFVVVDGLVAFSGGLDLCADRWDDRRHRPSNEERVNPSGRSFGPFHDLQAYVTGEAVEVLERIFVERWRLATGDTLRLPDVHGPPPSFTPTYSIGAAPIGVSRTCGRMLSPPTDAVEEIAGLYTRAIASAERFIYIENQYLTSDRVYRAFVDRFEDESRPPLDVVLMLPDRPEAVKEELALGLKQAHLLRKLRKATEGSKHRLVAYYPASPNDEGKDVATYIHSKVLAVDDRFLCVGSANTTNRSLGLDTELNLSWEADSEELARTLVSARAELLREHCGEDVPREALEKTEGLVDGLEQLVDGGSGRLRRHPTDALLEDRDFLSRILPDDMAFDPDRAELEENLWEALSSASDGPFATGISRLREWLEEPPSRR